MVELLGYLSTQTAENIFTSVLLQKTTNKYYRKIKFPVFLILWTVGYILRKLLKQVIYPVEKCV